MIAEPHTDPVSDAQADGMRIDVSKVPPATPRAARCVTGPTLQSRELGRLQPKLGIMARGHWTVEQEQQKYLQCMNSDLSAMPLQRVLWVLHADREEHTSNDPSCASPGKAVSVPGSYSS